MRDTDLYITATDVIGENAHIISTEHQVSAIIVSAEATVVIVFDLHIVSGSGIQCGIQRKGDWWIGIQVIVGGNTQFREVQIDVGVSSANRPVQPKKAQSSHPVLSTVT